MSREYFEFVRHQFENGMDRMNEFWGCRTPQDLVAVQTNFVRDTMKTVLDTNRRMADHRAVEHTGQNMRDAA
jgi:hypothetical protein